MSTRKSSKTNKTPEVKASKSAKPPRKKEVKVRIPRKENVADLCTGHVTFADSMMLEAGGVPGQVGTYEYGWVVLTNTPAPALLGHGMSQAYVDLLQLCLEQGFRYIHFDQDAEILEELAYFEW